MAEVSQLSRRERQIMDAVFALGEATVNRVVESIPSPPTTMAVRRMMHILEEKGHVRHRREGARYVYVPRTSPEVARRSALRRVVSTFFQGSVGQAMAALLETADTELSDTDLTRLQTLIKNARKEGR